MVNDDWDFSAYEMDFGKLSKTAETSPDKETTDADKFSTAADAPSKDRPAEVGQAAPQQAEEEPISKEEILELASKMDKATETVDSWIGQLTDICDHSEKRLPKGIRVSIRRLNDMADALQASKTIFEIIATKDDRRTRKIFEDNKIPYSVGMTIGDIERQDKKMGKSIQALKVAIDTEDPEARTLAREMKSTVLVNRSQAEMLANAVTQFVLAYPAKHGELALFSEIAATGDEKAMTQIDRMILLTENMVINVADAPAMIKAVEEKDTDRMTEILDRMIENQSARKTS